MFNEIPKNVCKRFPGGYVRCAKQHDCSSCELQQSLRARALRNHADLSLLNWRDVQRRCANGQEQSWEGKPLVLTEAAMKAHGMELKLQNQVFIPTDGPGVLPIHETGDIDGYLAVGGTEYTFCRKDFYGMLTKSAAVRFDSLFYTDIKEML